MQINDRTTMKLVAQQMHDCVLMATMIDQGLDDTRQYKILQETVDKRQKILDALKYLHDMPDECEHPRKWEGDGEF